MTWRRAQIVLLSAQGTPVAKIAEVSFTSDDRVRDVIHNFNADGFDSLYPKYSGGRPKTFTLPERREIKKIAKSKSTEHNLPFSTWSLTKLADFLVAGFRAALGAPGTAPPAVTPEVTSSVAEGGAETSGTVVDSLGKLCPIPVIDLARVIGDVPVGGLVTVLSDDEAARLDIPAWCAMREQEYVGEAPAERGTAYTVRRRV